MKHKKHSHQIKMIKGEKGSGMTTSVVSKEPSIWHESVIWFAILFFPIILFMCWLLVAIHMWLLE